MKPILPIAAALLPLIASAQQPWCAADEAAAQRFAQNPALKLEYEAHREHVANLIANGQRDGEKHIVPVVVHVLWENCDDNISLAQINDGLRIVNEDFNQQNADTNLTLDLFKPYAAKSEIEFRLARFDPDGNPTDGVVRLQTSATNDAEDNVKALTYWPSSQYMNIWVVNSINSFGSGGTILGYAQFPGSGSWSTYGVVIRNDAFGTIGTSSADGRTLSHELGHCFGLLHTFQGGCGSNCQFTGDGVCDTPPAAAATYDCSLNSSTCTNDANTGGPFTTNGPDMAQNFMSYNSCQTLFTEGQKEVMKAEVESYSQLINLTSTNNLEATGVIGLVAADFTSPDVVCEGLISSLMNSTLYDAETLQWNLPQASNILSTESGSISAIFEQPGLNEVELIASSGTNTSAVTKQVFVLGNEGASVPYADSFEDFIALPTNQYMPVNVDLDDNVWKSTNEAAFDGTRAVKMDSYGSCGSRSDKLYLQSLDFSSLSAATIDFELAYAQRPSGQNDYLRLWVRGACTDEWDLQWVQTAGSLATVASQNAPFAPAETSQWGHRTITIGNPAHLTAGTALCFEFVGRGGNNLFIDQFEITGTYSGDVVLRAPLNGITELPASVTLDWKSVAYVEGYELQVDKTPNFNSNQLFTTTTTYLGPQRDLADTEYDLSNLDLGTQYFWRVRTILTDSTGPWSDTWQFTVSETGLSAEVPIVAEPIVYPNPTGDVVNFSNVEQGSSICLYNATGILVGQFIQSNEMISISVANWPLGLYFAEIINQQQRTNISFAVTR